MTDAVTVYYLEMFARPAGHVPAPRAGVTVVHARRPTVAYYRFLYDTVGRAYQWRSRARLTDEALAALIHDPHDEVHVLHVEGTPAGFVEFDYRVPGEVEIVQFGLVPEFIGQGLGKYFLRWAIDHAFVKDIRRLWLHTCTHDHPRALPNYQAAGFALYKQETRPATA